MHPVQRRADALHAHRLLGQLDALLRMARERECQAAQSDVGLNALRLEVVDRAHRQTVLER